MSAAGMRWVLAVDLGSTGLKVGLVSTRGEVGWWASEPLETTYVESGPHAGAATQDAEHWWRRVVALAKQGLASGDIDPQAVDGVAVTGQWASTIPVDESGVPVGPCLMWNDTRGAARSAAVVGGPVAGYAPGALATWLRRSGGIPSPTGADPLAHFLHLQHDEPEIAARARWFLEPVDYLTQRFTGRPVATLMSMTAAWLNDNRDLSHLAYDPVLVRRAGVDADRLPPLVESCSVVGTVRDEVAAELGLRSSATGSPVRVITGLPDLHNAVVASGAAGLYEPHVALGTTAWVSCPLPGKKTDILHQQAAVPGLDADHYLLANNQDSAGRALEWLRERALAGLGTSEVPTAEEIVALAGTAPPGAGGVMFTPWLTGERSPIDDRYARAGFHNLGVTAGSAELARAVLEGVAFNLRWLLEAADSYTKRRLDPIRLLGGCARSDLWCQIVADVCDRSFERVADPVVAGLRGAGLTWALATGQVQREDLRALVPVDRVFAPNAAHRAAYDRMYAEFPRLHTRNKRFFAALNR